MDKLYDISQSKYKQLEKIRNVSSENVDATENENKQDDKMQNWEPKSKRMLQLFLTDGIQDILAVEYKPIRFLKVRVFIKAVKLIVYFQSTNYFKIIFCFRIVCFLDLNC